MPSENPPLNPERLRAARVRAGLTQAELARVIGVAGGERVSRWELGTSTPSTAMRARLAKALGIDLEELLPSQGPADLRRLRAEAGLTVAELAERGGLARGTIKRWEAGSAQRVRAPLDAVAAALGVSVDTLRQAIELSAREH
ncbi:helix-turn-helix transcriptional regulator [Janibacter sp. FSL W8-0316]|uniref:helix-turn-helix transcriptional regulator n=1 Tax=Janibacter sp. FSL W8-0316 TaxID=2975325 RepID=UPI0030FC525A